MEQKTTEIQTGISDILGSGIDLGNKVCVVAPGPNGLDLYKEIPSDYSIIVVNKAILIEEINPDLWVVAHSDNSWFEEANRQYQGLRAYRDVILPTINKTTLELYTDKSHSFKLEETQLQVDKILPIDGFIRRGGTISGIAIQLAYNLGVRDILLCGVDMSGNNYWDNSENEDKNVRHMHGAIWDGAIKLDPLLNHMLNELNVKITTLSKTTLNVPYFKTKKI